MYNNGCAISILRIPQALLMDDDGTHRGEMHDDASLAAVVNK